MKDKYEINLEQLFKNFKSEYPTSTEPLQELSERYGFYAGIAYFMNEVCGVAEDLDEEEQQEFWEEFDYKLTAQLRKEMNRFENMAKKPFNLFGNQRN